MVLLFPPAEPFGASAPHPPQGKVLGCSPHPYKFQFIALLSKTHMHISLFSKTCPSAPNEPYHPWAMAIQNSAECKQSPDRFNFHSLALPLALLDEYCNQDDDMIYLICGYRLS